MWQTWAHVTTILVVLSLVLVLVYQQADSMVNLHSSWGSYWYADFVGLYCWPVV